VELSQWIQLVECLRNYSLGDQGDAWEWWFQGQAGNFLVADVRHSIDCFGNATRWIHLFPIKVNVFVWRLRLDKLPSCENLQHRGVSGVHTHCVLCNEDFETVSHLFFECRIVRALMDLIARWLGIVIQHFFSYSGWCDWFEGLGMSSVARRYLEAVFFTTWWHIWNFRNCRMFGEDDQKEAGIFDRIVTMSFLWCTSRDRKRSINWVSWLQNPTGAII